MIMRQLGLATGALTSNRKGVGYQLWRGSRWVPLGAIAGCHCWSAAMQGCCSVPLLGAIAGCHCWGAIAGVPLLGATMHAIAGCHCWGAMAGC